MKFRTILENKYSSNLLLEALNDSQKAMVDSWNVERSQADEIHEHVFGNKDRLTYDLDLGLHQHDAQPHPELASHLNKHGYDISDYRKGIATSRQDGRQFKIGKVLSRTNAPQHIVSHFANDKNRSSARTGNSGYQVTISRHPHDVAAMSTGQGWTSCMDMEGGCNNHYLKNDIEVGTAVAYLHKKGDSNMKHPIARIALKPHESEHEEEDYHQHILVPEHSYGVNHGAFANFVNQWSRDNYHPNPDSKYRKMPGIYNDTLPWYVSHQNPQKLIDNKDDHYLAVEHHHLEPHHIDQLLNKASNYDLAGLAKHPNLRSHHVDKLIEKDSPVIDRELMKRGNINDEHFQKIHDRYGPNIDITQEAASNGRVDVNKHFDTIASSAGGMAALAQRRAGELTSDNRSKIINSPHTTPTAHYYMSKRKDLSDDEVRRLHSVGDMDTRATLRQNSKYSRVLNSQE